MALFTREDLPGLLTRAAEKPSRVYLLFGERYLCQTAAEQLEQALLQASGGTVHAIDGDQEDQNATLARLRSFSLLPGRQIYRVTDTRLFLSKQVANKIWDRALKAHAEAKPEQARRALRALLESGGLAGSARENELETLSAAEWKQCFGFDHPGGDLRWTQTYLGEMPGGQTPASGDPGDLLIQALAAGLPASSTLLLLAEEMDKRKKLFKLLKDEETVLDLSVEAGSSAKAQKAQKEVLKELLQTTLAEQGKTLAPGLTDLLYDRVGFHPVALVMELRKVMAYLGERRQITREDLDLLVSRTRQEALFELTTALAEGNREQALALCDRLLEHGIHPLAVVATLRNFIRGLLLCRALLEQPAMGFEPSMPPAAFQQRCLPWLKEREPWQKEFTGHPFAVYMQCKTAARFPLATLTGWMRHLLATELRLKGSPVADALLLQHLMLALLAGTPGQKVGRG